jgi:Zn-dependent peptidase ImmA (M78 family)
MPRSTEALVEPDILRWARDTAGLSVDEAAHSLQTHPERVQAWEDGDEHPSMAQLRRMATTYRRLLSDFYLPKAPDEASLPHDFRRMPGEVAFRYSKALRYQLRMARERRALALDLAAEQDIEVPQLTGHLQLGTDTERTGAELRRLLGVTLDMQRAWRDPRASYNGWRGAIERAGMLVFQVAGIAPREMLGFSLPDRPLPVIGVNRKLAPNGRTFTLLHESVHVFLGESSICDIEEGELRPPQEQRTEVFCNAVAGAALVPRDTLLNHPLVARHPDRPRQWGEDELSTLARAFGVGRLVILRRLLTFGRTTDDFYGARHKAYGGLLDASAVTTTSEDEEYRRNMPQEVVSDLGRPFTRLVMESYDNTYTSLSDVSRYLGLRAQKVDKLRALLVTRS